MPSFTSREMRSAYGLSKRGKRTAQVFISSRITQFFPLFTSNRNRCHSLRRPRTNKVPYSADQHMRNGGNYRRPRTGHEAAKDGTARFVTPPLPLRHSRYLTSPARNYACPRFPLCIQTRSPKKKEMNREDLRCSHSG